ncbi:UDP-N-acetylmuramate dehydrogenase [Streptomyces krungchingensis]|uniref:UDP-N-acetylmuramate dehydrogenase n=1 Tax=Streptomyces krungchingensis TaxID=1565034 RepID=UPI003CED517A
MGELLADHTTLRLGGPAHRLLTHTDPATWPDVARSASGEGTAPFVLGGGSNTLADDAGYSGTVIRMATHGATVRPLGDDLVEIVAQAGEPLSALVAFAVDHGLSGIEYLGGIPGTTGAAPVQNTGAYGQQISDTLAYVTAFDWHLDRIVELRASDCGFGYRASTFKSQPGRWTILNLTLHLTRSASAAPVTYRHLADAMAVPLGVRPPLAEAAQAVIADREQRGLTLPDSGPDARQAGSVFLNPVLTPDQESAVRRVGGPVHRDQNGPPRASAGWLLEQCGYRPGSRIGPGVYCSTARTLTLTTRESATATSFASALRQLATEVVEAYGIPLCPEPVRPGLTKGSSNVPAMPSHRAVANPSSPNRPSTAGSRPW